MTIIILIYREGEGFVQQIKQIPQLKFCTFVIPPPTSRKLNSFPLSLPVSPSPSFAC
jgi:hypothetical protein